VQRGAAGADGPHRRRDAGEGLRGEVGVLVDEQVRALDVAVQRGEVQRRDAAAASSRTRRSQQQPRARSATQAPTLPPVRIGRPQPHPHQQELLPEASRRWVRHLKIGSDS